MRLRRALAFSFAERYGGYVVSLVATAIISRILGPADIGAFAVGMALVGIVAVIREFGVSAYLVQETELTDDLIRSAFTVTVGVGLLLALIVLALAIPAGHFYADGRVTEIVLILSVGFVLTPLGSVSQALLTRDMKFGVLSFVRLLHAVVAGAIGVGLAVAGLGPQSLAWATVGAAAVNSIVSYATRPHAVRPNFEREGLRRVLAVGGPSTVISIIDDVVAALPELLLGRLHGLAQAGLFSRARGLSQVSNQLVARAAAPVFFAAYSAQRRSGELPTDLYLRANASVTAIGWTVLALTAVLAKPIVFFLYGPSWLEVVPLLRWLCLAAGCALLTSGANNLLLACGCARQAMWVRVTAIPIHLTCLLIGGSVGATAMAAAEVVATSCAGMLMLMAVRKHVGLEFSRQLRPLSTSGPIALCSVLGSALALLIEPHTTIDALAAIAAGGIGGLVAAIAAALILGHPLAVEMRKIWSSGWRS